MVPVQMRRRGPGFWVLVLTIFFLVGPQPLRADYVTETIDGQEWTTNKGFAPLGSHANSMDRAGAGFRGRRRQFLRRSCRSAPPLVAPLPEVFCRPHIARAKSFLQSELGYDTDDFIDFALVCRDEVTENAEMFGITLNEMIDTDQFITETLALADEEALVENARF